MSHAPLSPTLAKGLLVLAFVVCAVGMVGPFQGVEHALIPWDKAAHFMAFYGLTILMFTAFPTRRRLDLAALAIFAGAAIEVAQILTGRDGEIGDLCADALGALAVLAPVWLEHLRFPRVERRIAVRQRAESPKAVREAA
ncbi:hypothetical protein BH10PSE5_BH10PSE5_03850 [soil metagenome]